VPALTARLIPPLLTPADLADAVAESSLRYPPATFLYALPVGLADLPDTDWLRFIVPLAAAFTAVLAAFFSAIFLIIAMMLPYFPLNAELDADLTILAAFFGLMPAAFAPAVAFATP